MPTHRIISIVLGFVAGATTLQTAAADEFPAITNLTTTSATLTTNTSVCGSDPICASFSGSQSYAGGQINFSIDFGGGYSPLLAGVGAPLGTIFPAYGPGWFGFTEDSGWIDFDGTQRQLFIGQFILTPPASGTVPSGYATIQIPLQISFFAQYCVEGIPTICEVGSETSSSVDGLLNMNFTPVSAGTESFEFTFSDVPEPSGVLLMLTGLAGLAARKARLRRPNDREGRRVEN